MGHFYVPLPAVAEKVPCRPRLFYIRKTNNKMTVPYGSFLCTINFNERRLTPEVSSGPRRQDVRVRAIDQLLAYLSRARCASTSNSQARKGLTLRAARAGSRYITTSPDRNVRDGIYYGSH